RVTHSKFLIPVAADEFGARSPRCGDTAGTGDGRPARRRYGPRPVRHRRARRAIGFGHGDRFEHVDDLRATLLEPGWEQQLHAELVDRFILAEPLRHGGGALRQNAAGGTYIDRVEVVAILDLRTIGVAELFVKILLFGEALVGADV